VIRKKKKLKSVPRLNPHLKENSGAEKSPTILTIILMLLTSILRIQSIKRRF